jgi:hypothetical protein
LNKEDIKEAVALSLKEIPGVLMQVGAASKSMRHYQDINAAAKEGAVLSLAEWCFDGSRSCIEICRAEFPEFIE